MAVATFQHGSAHTRLCNITSFARQAATSETMSATRLPPATVRKDCQARDLIELRAHFCSYELRYY